MDDGIVVGILLGTDQFETAGVVEIAVDGTTAITLVGTESGTSDHAITTAEDSDGIVTTADDGTLDTQLTGTITGLLMVDGTDTVYGTVTNDETGTATTAVDGTDAITDVGTLSGMAVHETITADGDEAIVITNDDGNDYTHEYGTTAGLDHVDGTTTVAGTKTNDETATDETLDDGIDTMSDEATESGTLLHEIIAIDGDEAIIIT